MATVTFVLRAFRIAGSSIATGRKGLAAQAVSDMLKSGPESMVDNYLKSADIEAHDGRGEVDFTPDLKQAKRFATWNDAFEFWRAQSKTRPLRPDGRPNRPLTAINITVERIEE